jgi:competence ComEA-like helix-hairpin-helix protein
LRSVPGIGAKRYETLKDLITIEPEKVKKPPLPEEEVKPPVKPEKEKRPLKIEKVSKKVNINTASLEELVTLPGMNTEKAEAIIAYREKHGPFKTIGGLFYVPEMKVETFLKIEDLITVEPVKIKKPEAVPVPEKEIEIPVEPEEKPSEAEILILSSEEVAPPKVEEVPEPVVEEITHTVVRGDTLSKIAQRYLGDAKRYKEIAEYNGIKAPYLIHPGEIIRIPH